MPNRNKQTKTPKQNKTKTIYPQDPSKCFLKKKIVTRFPYAMKFGKFDTWRYICGFVFEIAQPCCSHIWFTRFTQNLRRLAIAIILNVILFLNLVRKQFEIRKVNIFLYFLTLFRIKSWKIRSIARSKCVLCQQ